LKEKKEVRLMVFVRKHLRRKLEEMVKGLPEYRNAEEKLGEAKEGFRKAEEGFLMEAEEEKTQSKSEREFNIKLREIQERASDVLGSKKSSIKKIENEIKELSSSLLKQHAATEVSNEVKMLQGMLDGFSLEDLHYDNDVHVGVLGHINPLNCQFKVEKNIFKRIKKELEKLSLHKIEVSTWQ